MSTLISALPAATTIEAGDLLAFGVVSGGTTFTFSKITGTNLRATILTNYAGASSIVTVGTITAGVWHGTIIGQAFLGTGGGGSTKFLREDNTWQTVATGSGDVVGPASATDNALARFDSTTGKLIQNSTATLDDSGNMIVTGTVTIGGGASFSSSASNFMACSGQLQSVLYIRFDTSAALHENVGLELNSSGSINWTTGANFFDSIDATIKKFGADQIGMRRGANGQTWIISRTFTDASNFSQFATVVTGSAVAFTVSELGTGIGTLTSYSFDKRVTATSFGAPDTGWVANQSVGDKITSVNDYAPPSFTGSDTVSITVLTAMATQLQAVTQKLQAIETVLVAGKFPNA